MNDQSHQRDPQAHTPDGLAGVCLSSGQQRRRLLRALGASGAIAGVGLPLSAHATGQPYCVKNSNNYHATASAVGSIVGSVTGGTPPTSGHNCGHYCSSGNWGTGWTNGKGRSCTYSLCADQSAGTKLRFWHVFELSDPGSGSPKYRYCADILNNYPTSDEAHWLTAVFNANKQSPFTYSPGGVVDLYKGLNPMVGGQSDPTISGKALTLFKDYLSQLS